MKKLLITAVFCWALVPMTLAGNEKFQLTLMLSPTVEWMRFGGSLNAGLYNDLWGPKLSYNFGLEYKHYLDPSMSISSGLMYMNKGFRNEIIDYSVDGNAKIGVTLAGMHIVAIPLYLNFHHRLKRRVEMIYTVGLAGGYLFSERIRNNYYSGEDVPQQGFFDLSKGTSNVNLLVDYYVGAHIGMGISAYLKNRIVLIIQPMYKWQVHDARDYSGAFASSDPFTVRLNSFGIDFRIGYFFNKHIINRKTEF